jgi:hypothetical protein
MTNKKKTEDPAIDLKQIAIALVSRTLDLVRFAPKASEWGYVVSLKECEVGDLVVNVSDVYANEDCLDRVGTVLEIRDDAIEIRRLDGLTRCAIAKSGTYLAAKGGENVST